MSRLLLASLLLVCACLEGCAVAPAPTAAATLDWPTPGGWRSETIPFPLSFAPTLPYRGIEELRFAPKFFDPKSPTYFTYSFAWLVDGSPAFDSAALSADLRTYFAGLAEKVAPKRFDPGAHHATVAGDAKGGFRGTVDTVDAFGDGRALLLHLAGGVVRCGGDRVALVLSLSPRQDAEIGSTLDAQRRALRCSAARPTG